VFESTRFLFQSAEFLLGFLRRLVVRGTEYAEANLLRLGAVVVLRVASLVSSVEWDSSSFSSSSSSCSTSFRRRATGFFGVANWMASPKFFFRPMGEADGDDGGSFSLSASLWDLCFLLAFLIGAARLAGKGDCTLASSDTKTPHSRRFSGIPSTPDSATTMRAASVHSGRTFSSSKKGCARSSAVRRATNKKDQ